MKEQITAKVRSILEEKIKLAKENFDLLRESLVSDSKSSAGDKHETARAMVQIEMEQAGKQVNDIENLKHIFDKISFTPTDVIKMGSLVETNKGLFLISIPLGKIEADGKEIFCLGNQAPLAKELLGKKTGDKITFMNHQQEIISVI